MANKRLRRSIAHVNGVGAMIHEGWPVFSLTYKGETKPLMVWSKELGISVERITSRLYRGWTVDEALGRKIRHHVHKMKDAPEYKCWAGMIQRCLNPNNHAYSRYGGRGIGVCERWRDFPNFYADIGPRPSRQHTLERIDNDRGYEPGNVVWGTRQEQARNRSSVLKITFEGKTLSLAEWAREKKLPRRTLRNRIFLLGWDFEKALTTPATNNDHGTKDS